jgi:5'-nucleotidase
VLVPGTRVTEVVLDDATVIVAGGIVQGGSGLTIATIDFSARGEDQYPYRGAPFAVLGVSYQQALSNHIRAATGDGGLGGLISSAQYPEGGEGRITQLPSPRKSLKAEDSPGARAFRRPGTRAMS